KILLTRERNALRRRRGARQCDAIQGLVVVIVILAPAGGGQTIPQRGDPVVCLHQSLRIGQTVRVALGDGNPVLCLFVSREEPPKLAADGAGQQLTFPLARSVVEHLHQGERVARADPVMLRHGDPGQNSSSITRAFGSPTFSVAACSLVTPARCCTVVATSAG